MEMFQKLGYLVLALGLVLPASASVKPASISGFVRDSTGVPQMGAAVEVLGAASSTLKVFTDDKGYYFATGLLPGVYNVKVSAPAFLPSLRERLGLRAGSSIVVNVTLNTLFESFQLAPSHGVAEEDDWKWTLRSVASRPILRMVDGDPTVVANAEAKDDHQLKGAVSFVAGSGSEGYGSSDMSTGFSIEHSLFSSGTLALNGNVGYAGSSSPTTVLRASYSHKLPNGSRPELAMTVRRLAAPDDNLHPLQALSLSMSDSVTLADFIELNVGSELQTIQFMGRVNAFRPFGSADIHLSPYTVLEYKYATSVPNGRLAKGFDSAPADLSESNPRMSLLGDIASLERAHHQELSVSRRIGDKTSVQLAGFTDRINNTALTGVGDTSGDRRDVLPDPYSGTFTYQGKRLDTSGMRAVLQRKLNSDLTATLDYSYGGVLDLDSPPATLQSARSSIRTVSRHALGGKMSGNIPRARTRWIASYRWTSGRALTPVDLFNDSPGQADPYLNIFVRQPIPSLGFLPGHMEALIELRNLLAQGYIPVLGQDGQTLYLVQSARTVRGGVSFTF
jgi:Carboxypeptidase regulatory-like domain